MRVLKKILGKTQNIAQKVIGSGVPKLIWNVLKAIPDFDHFYGETKKLIEHNGNKMITSLTSCRTPLSNPTQTLVKILHKGKLAIDNLFHLFLRIHLNDGTHLIFEKHGSPDMHVGDGPRNDEQTRSIQVSPGLTLAEMIQNAIRHMGSRKFFVYDPFQSNCQDFQLGLLGSSHQIHLTHEDRQWIDQDAKTIALKVPSWAKSVSSEVIQLLAKLKVL